MFVAFTPVGAPSLQKSTKVKIADAVGRNAMWSRGGRAVLCTPSQDRIDTAVTHSDEGLTAIHGDAYIREEPLDTALFREIDDYGEINGEFAGVMVTKLGLRVVTDRLNLMQLFVYRSPKAFVAASSVRAVLAFLDDAGLLRTVSLNRTAIAEFLDSGHLLGTKTHFEGIELLPGGTTLDVEIDDGEMSYSEDSYWQPEYGQYYETREEAVEAVADAIRSAVDLRIDSDLRIGVHLSGGMDSRLFLAAASEETELTAYTFGVPYNDEAAIARFLAKISGHDVVYDELEGGLADYAKTGILRTDGHASIRHFHHIPTMDSLVGECDRLFIGSSGGVVFGGSKLTESMFDGTFDAAKLHKKTSQFDRELWKAAFGPVGEFDSATVRSSFEETFEGIDAPTTANRSDIWNLQNRQQRFIFQAGPRSVNYYLPVSNPLVADSRVINAWLRIPPQMRLEGIRPDLLSTLDRKMAYVPTAGTWEPPAIPRLKYITGGLRLAASSKRLRSSLPGVETTDPFGYPDYAEWLRIDEHLGALVSTAVESFGERAWAVADELMGAYKSHQRGEADYHEELFILTTLELWLEHVFEEYPELAIESGESM